MSMRSVAIFVTVLAATIEAQATEVHPALVYGLGGKFDRSFNESAAAGGARWSKETGVPVAEFEPTQESQREQGLRRLVEKGENAIVAVGFDQAAAVQVVADENPGVKFAIIDAVVDRPNVQSILFKEQDGSFLVGVLAGLASRSDVVGFVGGMDTPQIRAFECGFEQGVHYVKPAASVLENMAGTTPAAWRDPIRGGELARSQIDRGADVIYTAAGETGLGVLQAASDEGKLSIGVDSNQNYLHPGSVLTSMVKGVDTATYSFFKAVKDDTFRPGVKNMGIEDGGVSWALDEYNMKLITPAMKVAVDRAASEIVGGSLKVIDYRNNNYCK
jgi:basic membrane protein A